MVRDEINKKKLTSRQDQLWPKLWKSMGKHAKLKKKQKWSNGKAPSGKLLEIMHCCLPRVHTTTRLSRQHVTAQRTSWRCGGSSSCLDESSHPWVLAGHPQYTGASHGGRLWMAQQHSQTQRVKTTTMDINMVAELDTTTTAPRLSTPRATNPRTGGRPSR